MSYCFSFQSPKALPTLSSQRRRTSLCTTAKYKPFHNTKLVKKVTSVNRKPEDHDQAKKSSLAIQFAALLATIEQPAFAITGVNNPEDLTSILIQLAIVTFCYFILMPPIIFNWLWKRMYRRKLLETYLQFMCIFIFFPGILLWAPFLNFRKFPRDPSLQYPWSKPEDPSKIKNDYLRYPWATPEDYD